MFVANNFNDSQEIQMKEIRIKIPQWSDFTKWFWDRFCDPRRKKVAEWIEYHGECLKKKITDYLWYYLDCNVDSKEAERFEKVEKMLDTIFKEQDKITEKLIMMK